MHSCTWSISPLTYSMCKPFCMSATYFLFACNSQGVLILHAVTSTTNPFTNGEAFAFMHQFYQKNVAQQRVMLGR